MRETLARAIQPLLALLLASAAAIWLIPATAPLEPSTSLAHPIGRVAQANPEVGAAVAELECEDADHCWQNFQHALLTWTPSAGAHAIPAGPLLTVYDASGGPEGSFGFATATARDHGGGTSQHFDDGGIFTAGSSALEVTGELWRLYLDTGAENGLLGYPISNLHTDAAGVGTQQFADGLIQVTQAPLAIWGEIAKAYTGEWGGADGTLGLAVAETRTYPVGDDTGYAQTFENGEVFSSKKYGTHLVSGAMLENFAARGMEASELGPPRSAIVTVSGGQTQDFAGGTAYLKSETGQIHPMMYGDIRNRYNELGGLDSTLGFPISDRTAVGDAFYQRFDNGALVWVPQRGAMAIDTIAFEEWLRRPAALGQPVQDSWTSDRGVHTKFDNREVISADGNLYSSDPVGPQTAVLICDSQCGPENSWLDRGARDAGYSSVVKRGYGGAGYSVAPPALTTSVANAVMGNEVMLPAGDPGVVILSLGGNDAAAGMSDGRIREDAQRLIARVQQLYPDTPLVVNGVLSRDDAGHARRRQVDKIITDVARSMGVRTISLSGWGTKDKLEYQDNVHLTDKGHQQMGSAYGPALRKALGF